MAYSVIDLFAGCGGLSRGLQSTGSFATDFAVELEPHAARTFTRNIVARDGKASRIYIGDIRPLIECPSSLADYLSSVELSQPGSADLLAGGPPCQGFSRNGVRRYEESGQRFYDLPINHLYKAFLDVLERTMPKVVLIENVREFLNAAGGKFRDDLFARLEELGYHAEARIVSAADYGVPQLRKRMIVLAARDGISVKWPMPTHFEVAHDGLFNLSYHTVMDAIGDLPRPTHDKDLRRIPYPEGFLSDYARQLRSKTGGVTNHIARKLSPRQLERIRAVGTGRMRDVHESLQTKAFYGSAYGRLAWDEPALTITTWVYHVGSGRFAHPSEDRAITMREAARLQSFDDDFIFPPLINPVSRMIGNAVPPLLGKALGTSIATALGENRETAVKDHLVAPAAS